MNDQKVDSCALGTKKKDKMVEWSNVANWFNEEIVDNLMKNNTLVIAIVAICFGIFVGFCCCLRCCGCWSCTKCKK